MKRTFGSGLLLLGAAALLLAGCGGGSGSGDDDGGGENTPPGFSSNPVETATEGQVYSYEITASDPDSDDTLTITAPTKPDWAEFTDKGDGTATLSGTPDNGDDADVVLVVSDGTDTAQQEFTISVTATASGNKWDEAEWDKGKWAD